VYKSKEVELIMLVKHLLYTEKYTIEGARQQIDQYRRSGELKGSARRAFAAEVAAEARGELEAVLAILDGRAPPTVAPPPASPAAAHASQRGGSAGGKSKGGR
jgi:hypothetical protein